MQGQVCVGAGYTVEAAVASATSLSAFSFMSSVTPHTTPLREAGLDRAPHVADEGTEAQSDTS